MVQRLIVIEWYCGTNRIWRVYSAVVLAQCVRIPAQVVRRESVGIII
jgi:hypothetical protein